MIKIKSNQIFKYNPLILFNHHRSISKFKFYSNSHQITSNESNHRSKKEIDWDEFIPTAKKLIESFGAFYNRSTNLNAAKKCQVLQNQGYRPVKRSKLDFRWWHEERQRGRIQPDHEKSYPLFTFQNNPHQQSNPNKNENLPSSQKANTDQRRHFTTFKPSFRRSPSTPRIQLNSKILHKNSPDIIHVVGDAANFQVPDLEYTSLDSDSEPATISFHHLGRSPGVKGIRGLRAGSLIELRRTNQSELGILVQTQGNEIVYVNRAGEIRLSILDNVMFTIHNVVSEDVALRSYDENLNLEGLNDAITPTGSLVTNPENMKSKEEIILNARRDCCRALRNFEKKLDTSHSILTKAGSYNLYYQFKHSNPHKSTQMKSEQGVQRLLGDKYKKDEIMVFALHQQLMSNADMFLANVREMRDESSFLVQPFHTLTALYTVREWIAQNSRPLNDFIEKCKSIILAHRSQQASTTSDTPLSWKVLNFDQWTQADCMFIEVFRTIATNQRLIQDQPYGAIAAYILKQIGLYDAEATIETWPSLTFDRFGAITLLKDVGILPAWQSVGLWNPDLNLTERISQQLEIESHNASISEKDKPCTTSSPLVSSSTLKTQTFRTNPTRVLREDPADSLRHDFGDLTVYIIDDLGAQELDDGISIESIDQETGEAWVHIHIADPTSHLRPSDELALQARSYLDTVYLPGFNLPMLPSSFIKSRGMSLGSRDKSTSLLGQKTLSFSAKINQRGEIVAYKVRPGVINNTKQVTYQVITKVLDGTEGSDQTRVLHIGPNVNDISLIKSNYRETLTIEELDQDDMRRIKQLGMISRVLTQKRVNDGAMGWHLPMAQVTVQPNPIISPSLGIPLTPRIISGIPTLSIDLPPQVEDFKNHTWGMNSAQSLVSEMMIMAGRLAGRFYVDESIKKKQGFKLAFRSQASIDSINSIENQERFKELRKEIDPRTGLMSPFKFQKSRIKLMPAVNGLEPMGHFPLGINDEFGYCKVTSPLRRYGDLVAHWQIKNAILKSQGKQSYQDNNNVLSIDGMKDLINRLDRDNKPMINLDRKMNLSWMCYILRRIMKDEKLITTHKNSNLNFINSNQLNEENFKELIKNKLTGIILQDGILMKFTNRFIFKTYIPELGLRASLIIEKFQDCFSNLVFELNSNHSDTFIDPIGLRLPIKIVYINPEDHLILNLDLNRFDKSFIHSSVI